MILIDRAAWEDLRGRIVGSADPDSVRFSCEPERYPCLAKWSLAPGVYREVTCCFFYPDEALTLLAKADALDLLRRAAVPIEASNLEEERARLLRIAGCEDAI